MAKKVPQDVAFRLAQKAREADKKLKATDKKLKAAEKKAEKAEQKAEKAEQKAEKAEQKAEESESNDSDSANGAGPLITISNAKKWFPIKAGMFSPVKAHVRAVDGVDMEINRGETVGIVGESGCGKTTLGRLVMGLIPMTDGTITFDGKDIKEINQKELRRRLQIVFQDPGGSMNP